MLAAEYIIAVFQVAPLAPRPHQDMYHEQGDPDDAPGSPLGQERLRPVVKVNFTVTSLRADLQGARTSPTIFSNTIFFFSFFFFFGGGVIYKYMYW